MDNKTALPVSVIAICVALAAAAAWNHTSTALRESRAQLVAGDLQQLAALLQEDQALIQELQSERYAEKDDQVKIVRYEDLAYPGLIVHAFYVKYLLPIYFDVQSMEHSTSED